MLRATATAAETRRRRRRPTATTTATATATATATPPAGPFAIGDGPDGIALGAGAVWAVASGDGTLTRIDPQTGETTSVEVGENPDSVIVAFDSVWVSVTGEDKVVRVSTDPQPEVIETLRRGREPRGHGRVQPGDLGRELGRRHGLADRRGHRR